MTLESHAVVQMAQGWTSKEHVIIISICKLLWKREEAQWAGERTNLTKYFTVCNGGTHSWEVNIFHASVSANSQQEHVKIDAIKNIDEDFTATEWPSWFNNGSRNVKT